MNSQTVSHLQSSALNRPRHSGESGSCGPCRQSVRDGMCICRARASSGSSMKPGGGPPPAPYPASEDTPPVTLCGVVPTSPLLPGVSVVGCLDMAATSAARRRATATDMVELECGRPATLCGMWSQVGCVAVRHQQRCGVAPEASACAGREKGNPALAVQS